MMDLDGFKEVNDRHGHVAGDALLRFFAGEIKGQVRPVDTPARFGGDEFVVLMKGVDSQRAEIISRQLMDHFEKVVFEPDGLALHCRISVGHAEIDAETEDAAAVLAAADSSMYEVKRARKAVG
jgi:diguanylate cyclase (GGDEF)-like protein